MDTKRLLAGVTQRAARARAAQTAAEAAYAARNAAMLEAYRSGATPTQIQVAAGLSREAVSRTLGRPTGIKRTRREPAESVPGG